MCSIDSCWALHDLSNFQQKYSSPCLPHFKCCFATGLHFYQFRRQEVSLIIFDDYGAEEGAWRPQGVRWLVIWRWFHSTFKLRRSNLHVIFSLFWYFLELGNSSKSPWTSVLIIIRLHIDSVAVGRSHLNSILMDESFEQPQNSFTWNSGSKRENHPHEWSLVNVVH